MTRRSALTFLALAVALGLPACGGPSTRLVTVVPGCVTILPYERELLARPDMQFDANAAVMLAEEHGATTREGSAGAFGGGGGGCGCN